MLKAYSPEMNELWRGRLGEDYKSLPQNLLPPGHKKWFARDPNLDRVRFVLKQCHMAAFEQRLTNPHLCF